MTQLNSNKPCTTRDHVESIEQPGHCVWCGVQMHSDTMPAPAPAPAPAPDPLQVVLGTIWNAIGKGGTLVLTGPNSVVSPGDSQFGATLEPASGEWSANAYGINLGETLVALVADWMRHEQDDAHQAEHDRGEG